MTLYCVTLRDGDSLDEASVPKPFLAIVIIRQTSSAEWQQKVSEWLVESGCRYMLAWGADCSSWDDSVDIANILAFPDGIPDDKFVMTTWHDDEPLEDVMWFAKNAASLSPVPLETTLLLQVGDGAGHEELRTMFRDA